MGTELVRQSQKLAEKLGCEYTYLAASGEYSGRIFPKLGFTLDREYVYADYKNFKTGEAMLADTGIHKKARVFYIKNNLENDEKKSQ